MAKKTTEPKKTMQTSTTMSPGFKGNEPFDDMDDMDEYDDIEEGFNNKGGALGYGIFTNNLARNILRTALIVLVILLIQDKYVKDMLNKVMKNLPLPKAMRNCSAMNLIVIALTIFLVLTFL